MRRGLFAAALAALLCALAAGAEEPQATDFLEWSLSADLTLAPSLIDDREPSLYETFNTRLGLTFDFLTLVGDFSMKGDRKYSSEEDFMFGRYFTINNGGVVLDFGTLTLQGGRFVHADLLETPYSLFISAAPLPAVLMDASFRLGRFFYESRWVRLTNNSREGWPDRGMNYKVFALQVGDFRFGVQDSAVYVDRVFDVEYFLSPVPHIVTQLVVSEAGKPWSEDTNDNSIMGLFVELRRPATYACAQWLVDDINLDFLIPKFIRDEIDNPKIPQKMAWSVGGRHDFPFGTLGFYHAGATKYTFEPSLVSYPYGYTYYPGTEYTLKDASTMTLEYADNYVGYKYGENNIAFRVDYARRLGPVDFGAALEYVVSGSKSIANPWHDGDFEATNRETRLLDDEVLEHTLSLTTTARWPIGRWTPYCVLMLGGVANELAPVPALDGDGDVFQPQPGEHRFLYRFTAGAQRRCTLPSPRATRP